MRDKKGKKEKIFSPHIGCGVVVYLHSMNDLIKVLQEQFCKELNDAWKRAVTAQKGDEIDTKQFYEILSLVKEAIEEGYLFTIDYEPVSYLTERIMGTDEEKSLFALEDWKKLRPLDNMYKQAEQPAWSVLKKPLEELRNKIVRPILHTYVSDHARVNGPFFMKGSADMIQAFGSFGDVGLEIMLVTMVNSVNISVEI